MATQADPGTRRLVIVGASLAGLRAAESARASGWKGSIVLVGAEQHLPYDRPPLSKAVLDGGDVEVTPFRAESELADDLGVTTVLGTPATALRADRREVLVGDTALAYDALIIATGAAPVVVPVPGADLAGVHSLRTFDDAVAIRTALENGARTVVIGAGFIGSEIASAARKRELPVTIVERLDVPLSRSLGTEPGEICADLHRAAGTDLRLGAGLVEFLGEDGRVTGVRLDDGSTVAADLVVVGVGARPATGWLADSGLDLHPRDGGIVCSATLRTSLPDVWAAGDVAHFPNPMFDDDLMRPEHWTNAAEQGALAARNAVGSALGGTEPEALSTVPYFWSDWYGHRLQFVGTPSADEVVTVGPRGPGGVVLYRRGNRLVGAFTLDRASDIMKFRRRILKCDSWVEAVVFAEERTGAHAERPVSGGVR